MSALRWLFLRRYTPLCWIGIHDTQYNPFADMVCCWRCGKPGEFAKRGKS